MLILKIHRLVHYKDRKREKISGKLENGDAPMVVNAH